MSLNCMSLITCVCFCGVKYIKGNIGFYSLKLVCIVFFGFFLL